MHFGMLFFAKHHCEGLLNLGCDLSWSLTLPGVASLNWLKGFWASNSCPFRITEVRLLSKFLTSGDGSIETCSSLRQKSVCINVQRQII